MADKDVKVLIEVDGGRLVQSVSAAERARIRARLRASPRVIARGGSGGRYAPAPS